MDGNIIFYSVSADGRVVAWKLVKVSIVFGSYVYILELPTYMYIHVSICTDYMHVHRSLSLSLPGHRMSYSIRMWCHWWCQGLWQKVQKALRVMLPVSTILIKYQTTTVIQYLQIGYFQFCVYHMLCSSLYMYLQFK